MADGLDASTPARRERAAIALRGLAVGDAFGDQFFGLMARHDAPVQRRMLSAPPWAWTDDTNMAISIVEVLRNHGAIDQDALAASFVERYAVERAYGPSMNRMLRTIGEGAPWRDVVANSFGGQGSYGNGAAMRVAPLGAYFADDLAAAREGAALSATVTHTHPEAVAGAIGVAVAAAQAWRLRGDPAADPLVAQGAPSPRVGDPRVGDPRVGDPRVGDPRVGDPRVGDPLVGGGAAFLDLVIPHLPPSEVRSRTERARSINAATEIHHAALMLGNGTGLSAQDTVPFALWCAGHYLNDYEGALWAAAASLGDMDTIAAIVGGIVVGYAGHPDGSRAIPPAWAAACEPLPDDQ